MKKATNLSPMAKLLQQWKEKLMKYPLWEGIFDKIYRYTGGERRADEARLAIYSSWRKEEDMRALFEKYIIDYGRSYKTLREKEMRFQHFKYSLGKLDEYNYKYAANDPVERGVGPFADWTYKQHWRTRDKSLLLTHNRLLDDLFNKKDNK